MRKQVTKDTPPLILDFKSNLAPIYAGAIALLIVMGLLITYAVR